MKKKKGTNYPEMHKRPVFGGEIIHFRAADSRDVARALVRKLGKPERGCAALDPFVIILGVFLWLTLLAIGHSVLFALRF